MPNRIPVFAILALLAPPATADAPAQHRREISLGDVRIPFYLPAWAGEHPLDPIEALMESGRPEEAADMLERMEEELAGNLLPPQGQLGRGAETRAGSSDEVLARWARGRAARGVPLPRFSMRSAEPLGGASPLLWHPDGGALAQSRLELALERGDLDLALRLVWCANRPSLPPELRRLVEIHAARGLEPAPPVENGTAWRSTRQPPSPEGFALPRELRRVFAPLDLGQTPAPCDPADLPESLGERSPRRMPLPPLHALVNDAALWLPTGSAGLRIRHRGTAELEQVLVLAPSRFPQMRQVAGIPIAAGEWILASARTGEPERASTIDYTPIDQVSEPRLVFQRPILIRSDGSSAESVASVPGLGEIDAAWNLAGAPLFHEGVAYLPLCRGWHEVEMAIAALDLYEGALDWQRRLGVASIHWHSKHDLEALLPALELLAFGGDLVIVTPLGFLARLDRRTGENRGVLSYPRREPAPATGAEIRVGGSRYRTRPAPRIRAPGPVVYLPRGASAPPLLVLLPPDSRALLGLDLEAWSLAWRHELSALTQLLGESAGEILLLDAEIPRGGREVELRRIDPATGRLLSTPERLLLGSPPARPPIGEAPESSPLLTGVPRLAGREVWVPARTALEVFRLDRGALPKQPRAGGRPPDLVLPWPEGCTGGTPIPLPGGRLALIGRGDVGLGTRGTLEIFAAASE